METVMIALIVFGAAFLIGYGIVAWRKKRRADTIAKEHAEDQKNPMTAGMAYPVWTKREATNYPSAPTPSPTVIYQDSGMSPLMYGALGYMIGSSGNSHAAHPEPSTVNIGTCPAEGNYILDSLPTLAGLFALALIPFVIWIVFLFRESLAQAVIGPEKPHFSTRCPGKIEVLNSSEEIEDFFSSLDLLHNGASDCARHPHDRHRLARIQYGEGFGSLDQLSEVGPMISVFGDRLQFKRLLFGRTNNLYVDVPNQLSRQRVPNIRQDKFDPVNFVAANLSATHDKPWSKGGLKFCLGQLRAYLGGIGGDSGNPQRFLHVLFLSFSGRLQLLGSPREDQRVPSDDTSSESGKNLRVLDNESDNGSDQASRDFHAGLVFLFGLVILVIFGVIDHIRINDNAKRKHGRDKP